jgi:hypothetical protein
MTSTAVKYPVTTEPTAIKAWAEGRTIYLELTEEDLDEDITVPGVVAGNFQLPLESE